MSDRRADAVKKYLVEGSGRTDITSGGFSFTRPIDTNDTEAGRANNRRVQLEVEGAPQQPLEPQLPGRELMKVLTSITLVDIAGSETLEVMESFQKRKTRFHSGFFLS